MSNVAEILRKVEHLNGETVNTKNEEFLTYYELGRKYFLKGDYRNAEYWWNKGVRNGCKKSKKALISLELQTMNFNSIYNIPVSACRRTCGGNAPHYRWDYKITTGR